MPTLGDLDNNYTEEVAAFYGDRLRKLEAYARQWPIRVAVSTIGKGHPTHDAGTRQIHMLCWLEKDKGIHCGQTVYVLATGQTLYCVRPDGIVQGIKTHIAQCHMEVYDNGGHTNAQAARH